MIATRSRKSKCNCPIHCKYCGAKRKRDSVGHYCPTPNCHWQYGYYDCTLHKTSPIRHYSRKRAAKQRARRPLFDLLVKNRGDVCELQVSPNCRHRAMVLNHKLKQGQGGPDTEENCELSCDICNTFLETMARDEQIKSGHTIERRSLGGES